MHAGFLNYIFNLATIFNPILHELFQVDSTRGGGGGGREGEEHKVPAAFFSGIIFFSNQMWYTN